MIISQCVYFLYPVYFLSHPFFASLFKGPTSVLSSLATLIFHSLSASFFPDPTLEGFSVIHTFFFYTFYAMSFVSDFPRQCSDQPEIGIAYMTFLVLCLYKKIGLRKNDTRKSRKEMILSDPDTNSLLHVHFVFLICTILLCPVDILQHIAQLLIWD